MNKYTLGILLFLLFSTQIMLSQNSVSYSPSSTTISANSGVEILVPITVNCSGNMPTTLVGVQPANTCSSTDGYTGINYTDGITSLTPGHSTVIKFKFKKTVTANTSITYLFTNNGSCNSPQIKITVNYVSSPTQSCTLSPPPNLNVSNITTNSVKLNWDHTQGALYYRIYYRKSGSTVAFSMIDAGCCSATINSLEPDTKYEFSVYPMCSNGSGYASYISATTLCLNNLPSSIDNLSIIPYSYGYKVDFTPIPNFTNGFYTLEYVDLVTNSSGVVSPFSLLPAGATYPNFYYVQTGHSFKIRVIGSLGCSSTYSNWLTVNGACPLAPTELYVISSGGNGSFNWSQVSNSINYQGEFLIYNLSGQNVTGTFMSTSNSYSNSVNTNTISGDKFIKFRIKSQCSNGTWSDFSDWSRTTIWNN